MKKHRNNPCYAEAKRCVSKWVPCGGKLVAAVSGGADSIAMLHMLWLLQQDLKFKLYCAHLHHGIRGRSAQRDLEFVRDECARLGVDFYCEEVDVPAIKKNTRATLEEAARDERYKFYRRAMINASADITALAHHADDQLETILMHLFRGSGMDGLLGMAQHRRDEDAFIGAAESGEMKSGGFSYIRPLLRVTRAEIEEYCNDNGLTWREDATNADDIYARNALRNNIIPQVKKIYPGAAAAAVRMADLLRGDAQYLNEQAKRTLNTQCFAMPYGGYIIASALKGNIAASRRVVKLALNALGVRDAAQRHIDGVASLASRPNSSRVNLPQDFIAERGYAAVHIISPQQQEKTSGGLRAEFTIAQDAAETGDGIFRQTIPVELLDAAAFRYTQPGDRIQPFGSDGSQSMKEFFQARRIDRPLRAYLPVLAVGSSVIWAVGAGASELVRPRGRKCAMVEYTGDKTIKINESEC